ncbi:MAG: SIS domain-containing protein [Anaerolineae bacterium]|nr:SIS domain-containing protein [Anaerolineae bacterium]
MDRLLAEIREQPAVLQRLLEEEYSNIQQVAQAIREREVHYALIAARGTSDHAATYAKYLLGARNRLPVALAAPSLYTLYESPPRIRGGLVMGISQSGMSPDIVSVVRDAREQGALTVAITNNPDSRLARVAEHLILCRAGEEKSVAATKTYTAELMAVALLSVALAEDEKALAQLHTVPEAVQSALTLEEQVKGVAELYREMQYCAVVSRGYNYATALEVGLKVKELTYVSATSYSSADFMHGPIATVEEGSPVLLIAPRGKALDDLLHLAEELRARRANLLLISDARDLGRAPTLLQVSPRVEEWLSPMVLVVPGQLFAYHLARAKGLDPQHPRGLRKVTETR